MFYFVDQIEYSVRILKLVVAHHGLVAYNFFTEMN